MKIILLLPLLLSFTLVKAQNLFEDESGETTLNFNSNYYFFRFNTSETSFKIGSSFQEKEPFKRKFGKTLTVSARFSSSDGIAMLYKDKEFSFSYELNAKPGLMKQWQGNNKSKLLQIFLDLKIGRSTYKLGDSTKSDGIRKEIFIPSRATLNLNYVSAQKWFLGAAVGYKNENNYDDLDDGVITQKFYSSQNLSIVKTKEAKVGQFEAKDALRFDLDAAYLPGWFEDQIGFTLYQRNSFFQRKSKHDIGLGLFLLPKSSKNAGYSSIGGIGFTFKDLSDSEDSNKSVGERGILYLFAGFKLQ